MSRHSYCLLFFSFSVWHIENENISHTRSHTMSQISFSNTDMITFTSFLDSRTFQLFVIFKVLSLLVRIRRINKDGNAMRRTNKTKDKYAFI